MDLGEKIRHFRKIAGLTQSQLAEQIGLKQYAIAKYESNVHSPNPQQLIEIALALHISINQLYGISEEMVPSVTKGPKTRRSGKMQEIYEELSPTDQRALLKQAKALLAQEFSATGS